MYINVTETKGFEVGCDTGVFAPAVHRVLIDKGEIHGAENFHRRFKKEEWQMLVNLIYTLPSGTYGDYSWQRE